MQRISRTKALLAAVVTLGALGAASTAQARTDLHFSIGIPAYGYVQPAPVYVQPQPYYVQPQPVYVHPSSYYGHGRVNDRRGAWGDADRDGIPNVYDHRFNGPRHNRGARDADRDGVPNRFDNAPRNPYRY
ncbi:MAG: PXPV repeat protein [Ramlibacter sp.]